MVSQKGYASFPHNTVVFRLTTNIQGFNDVMQHAGNHVNQTINVFCCSNGLLLGTSLANTHIYAHTYKNKQTIKPHLSLKHQFLVVTDSMLRKS